MWEPCGVGNPNYNHPDLIPACEVLQNKACGPIQEVYGLQFLSHAHKFVVGHLYLSYCLAFAIYSLAQIGPAYVKLSLHV